MYVQKTNQLASGKSMLTPVLRETPLVENSEIPALSAQIAASAVGAAETIDAISIDGTSYTLDGTITAANIAQLGAEILEIIQKQDKYISVQAEGYDIEFRALHDGTNIIAQAVGEPVVDSITFSSAGAVTLTKNEAQFEMMPYDVIVAQIDGATGDGIVVDGASVYSPAANLVAGTDTAADARADLQFGLANANAANICSHIDRIEVEDIEVGGSPRYKVRLWVSQDSTLAIADNAVDVAGQKQNGKPGFWFNA